MEGGLDTPSGTLPWSEVDARVAEAAARLEEAGAVEGRTVAVLVRPDGPGVVLLLGALRTRARVAVLNPRLTPTERGAALEGVAAELVVDATGDGSPEPSSLPGGSVDPPPGPGEVVLWTSGTSGRPRGVVLTQEGLRHSADAARERLGLGPDDRWYASLSPAHVGGLALITRAALLGSTLVTRGSFDAEELSGLVDSGEVTHASLVPAMVDRLLEARGGRPLPDTLRCVLVGGAACPRDLLGRALEAGVPVALTYGMTEATSQVATATPEEVRGEWAALRDGAGGSSPDAPGDTTGDTPGDIPRDTPGDTPGHGRRPIPSAGRPLPGVEVRTAAAGEILVRGPTVAAAVLGQGSLADPDGWYATGDLGRLGDDGRLRVTGRKGDRIVSGGYNVDPAEVEDALRRHPSVADAAVVGVPDERWGERVAALVVLREAVHEVGDDQAPRDALDAHVRSLLASPKVPRLLAFGDRIPRNPNGKVDRDAVRALLEG